MMGLTADHLCDKCMYEYNIHIDVRVEVVAPHASLHIKYYNKQLFF